MKCISCSAPISPAFKHAIQINSCPACGKEIMNDNMKELLSELKSALEAMPNDPEGLAGWLLSNYQLIKIGTGEPVAEFYGNIKANQQLSELKIAPNRLSKFYKQAGVKSPKEYAELAKQLNDGEGADYGSSSSEDVDDESILEDPEYTKMALHAMQESNMSRSQLRQAQRSIPNQQNLAYEEELHPMLQNDRMARLEKQYELESGGKVGKISRAQ